MSAGEETVNLQLVREVEKHPLLYNFRLPDYSKRELVEAAWNEIAQAMNEEAIVCKEKWRNLRTVFVRKMKPLPTGVVRRRSYYLRDAMSFLTPFIKQQKNEDPSESVPSPLQSELENTGFSEPEHNEFEDGDVVMQSMSSRACNNQTPKESVSWQSRKQLKRSFADVLESSERTEHVGAVEPQRIRLPEVDESRKYFLLSLLPEVQKLSDQQMKHFRRRMLDALDEAEAQPFFNGTGAFLNETNGRENGGAFFPEFSPKKEI